MRAYHFNWFLAWQNFPRFYWGLALGLELAVLCLLIGSLIGMAGAFARTFGPRWLRIGVTAYVEFIRNVPLLLLVYFAFYGLPKMGITALNNVWSFIAALSVYSGAYLTEVFRAGVNSVPVGYVEAGKAVGLTPWQRVRFVILPVTFRIILPSLSNTFISLFKDTSLASALAVPELTYAAEWLNVNTFRTIEAWTFATAMYLAAGYGIALVLRRTERRYAVIR
jgi:polar amino acid transport system permease protein